MSTKDESGFFYDWPLWAKPTMALAVMILLGGAWIGVPFFVAWRLIEQSIELGVVTYQPMTTVLVAMTTATIAGIFLFMTLRIDRGTRLKAQSAAKKAVKENIDILIGNSKKKAKRLLRKTKKKAEVSLSEIENTVERIRSEAEETVTTFLGEKFVEGAAPDNIRKEIEARLTEEVLRRHVEAVLMVDSNAQIVGEYAKQRAGDLDPATIERLVGLMDETVKTWRGLVQAERRRRRKGFLKAFFSRFSRSSRDG